MFPSEVIDGIPQTVDTVIREGIAGDLDARALARELSAVSYDAPPEHTPPKPWRTLALFGLIVGLITLIAAVGLAADFDPESPFLYPVGAESVSPPVTTPVQVAEVDESQAINATAVVYDPFGDGTESDETVSLVFDGNSLTAWSTEVYSKPIREFKDGVGLVFDVDGSPSALFVTGTPGTTYLVGWAPTTPSTATGWEHVARGTLQESQTRIQLPNRIEGLWRLWLTGLPERADGSFQSRISQVRFVP